MVATVPSEKMLFQKAGSRRAVDLAGLQPVQGGIRSTPPVVGRSRLLARDTVEVLRAVSFLAKAKLREGSSSHSVMHSRLCSPAPW